MEGSLGHHLPTQPCRSRADHRATETESEREKTELSDSPEVLKRGGLGSEATGDLTLLLIKQNSSGSCLDFKETPLPCAYQELLKLIS